MTHSTNKTQPRNHSTRRGNAKIKSDETTARPTPKGLNGKKEKRKEKRKKKPTADEVETRRNLVAAESRGTPAQDPCQRRPVPKFGPPTCTN